MFSATLNKTAWTATALVAAALLGAPVALAASGKQRPTAREKACDGPACTCCMQHDAEMKAREQKDARISQRSVTARGRRLISYKKMTDKEAMEADMARILRRSVDPAQAKQLRVLASATRGAGAGIGIGEQAGARAVPGFSDRRVPDGFGGYLARIGYVRKHGPWHAVHNADRLTPDELQFVEKTLGWKAPRDAQGRLIKQEGMRDNGYKFLGMHGGMVQAATQAGVTGGKIRPFTPAEWAKLKPFVAARNPDIAAGMQMVMDMLATYDAAVAAGTEKTPQKTEIGDLFGGYDTSIDIFGNWMQTTQRRDANVARLTKLNATKKQNVQKTAGLHNLVHVVLSNPGSDIDMGNPDLNLYNELFWLHHGTIEKAKDVFLAWYARPKDKAEYARVQAEESTLMNPGTAQGQRMLRDINKLDKVQFGANERLLWTSIQSKTSPEALLRASGAIQ